MEKRTLAAIALSILILFAFRYWEERRVAELRKHQPVVTKTEVPPAPKPVTPEAPPLPVEQHPQAAAPAPSETVGVPKKVVVEGDLYRAVLDSQGAVLASWQLKHYRSGKSLTFEMVAANHNQETRPYPGSISLEDPADNKTASLENYEIEIGNESGSPSLETLVPPVTVTMRLRRGDLFIEKIYHFQKDNYLVDLGVNLQKSAKPLSGKILIGEDLGPEHEHLLNPSMRLVAVSNQGGKVKRDSAPKDENAQKIQGNVRWVGLDMQYFSLIAIPSRSLEWFEIQKKPIKTVGLDGKEVARDLLHLGVPVDGNARMALYLGPKEQRKLQAVSAADLSEVIDYGMFSILVRPLLAALKWIEQYVHNYGWAIIILTAFLTLLLFPFRLKQMLSMKKMQVVQPKIKEIQERYKRYKKTDPKRAEMNREVMDVYKAHNVNPLGGCLPLLIQMPLLFAFYQLLAASIELRQAPFFGWIHDLSMKDPYYVLPIIMGVTMLISQKMTPMAPGTDPTQAKMMMIMPVVFTLMFLNVSSGLNLYFLCSNIFQIGFQKVAERWLGDKRAAVKP
jgi:YidC/Oxa1 family membrane protein insertase